jgi:hypothetical protein
MGRTWVAGGEGTLSGSSTRCLVWEDGRAREAGSSVEGDVVDVGVEEREGAVTWGQWTERWGKGTGPPTRKIGKIENLFNKILY